MNILAIIDKKRYKEALSFAELDFAFNGYYHKKISDYQMSALLMAICLNGLNEQETFDLTEIFIKSGQILDLSKVDGIIVDKHSTGGVGDKTSFIIGPIVAACGLKMAKMSGRGLGLTGGTIDKLESIPGFDVDLTFEEFIKQVNTVGYVNVSQNKQLVPLDKEIYALRDATATAESLELIAVSIMSKKIASGADTILIDVKYGSGALIKTKEDAVHFSNLVKKIGQKYHKKVITVIDSMNIPLGDNIGNSLEIMEAMEILQGKQGYLTDLCFKLSATLISASKNISYDTALHEAKEAVSNGKAYQKFLDFVAHQKGDITKLPLSPIVLEVKSHEEGILKDISAYKIAKLASILGCFRHSKEDQIDPGVGIVLNKHLNDKVHIDDVLCYLYVNDPNIKLTFEDLACFKIERSD